MFTACVLFRSASTLYNVCVLVCGCAWEPVFCVVCACARVCVCGGGGGGRIRVILVLWCGGRYLVSCLCVFVCVCSYVCVCVGMYDAVYVYVQRSLVVLGVIINTSVFSLRECALCGLF